MPMDQLLREPDYQKLRSKLSSISHYNGTIVHCVKRWLLERDDLRDKIKLFGAPFEADAQCVSLEKQGVVDAILSNDSDMVFHGAQLMYSGYNNRKKRTDKIAKFIAPLRTKLCQHSATKNVRR